jgi:hypothetical protein
VALNREVPCVGCRVQTVALSQLVGVKRDSAKPKGGRGKRMEGREEKKSRPWFCWGPDQQPYAPRWGFVGMGSLDRSATVPPTPVARLVSWVTGRSKYRYLGSCQHLSCQVLLPPAPTLQTSNKKLWLSV